MTRKKSPLASARQYLRRLFLLAVTLGVTCLVAAWIPSWRLRATERHFETGRQAIKRGDLETAMQIAADLEPRPEFAPHRHYLVGLCKLREGKLSDALTELQYSCYHPQLELDAFVASGQALYQSGRVNEAVRKWAHVLSIDPEHIDTLRWLSVYFFDVGATGQSERYLQSVAKLDPKDGRPHRMLGLIEFDKHNFEQAIEFYRESLRRDPSQPDREALLAELAESEVKSRNYDGALEVLKECQPSVLQVSLRAECYINKGDIDRALGLVTAGLENAPDDAALLEIQGRCLLHQGKLQDAQQAFAKALQSKPREFGARVQLAQVYHRLGKTGEARRQSEIAKEHRDQWARFSELNADAGQNSTDIPLRLEIAKLALELERQDLASIWLRAALYLDPNHEEAAAMMGKLQHLGDVEREDQMRN